MQEEREKKMKKDLPICRDCGERFKKRLKRGFANQCDDCALDQEEPEKYLGFNDGALNKATNIAVYRGSDKTVREKIANQKNRVH